MPTLLPAARDAVVKKALVGRQMYWIMSCELRRNFKTGKHSRQLHKVQLWSLSWVTYIQAGLGKRWSRGIGSCTPSHQKECKGGFPGGAVVKNPPANAGDTGSSPDPGRSHMLQSSEAREPQLLSLRSRAREPQLLSPCATTTEACTPRARAPQQEKPPQWEARAPQRRVAPARCN